MLQNESIPLNESMIKTNAIWSHSPKFSNGYLAKTVAYGLLFLVSVVGNSLILYAVHIDKRLRTMNNFLIANMAVSDLLSTFFRFPLHVQSTYHGNRWFSEGVFGEVLCKVLLLITDTSISVSFYSSLSNAFDRFMAVAYPLRLRGLSSSLPKYIITGIWILSILIVSPSVYGYCEPHRQPFSLFYFKILIILTYVIPLILTSTLYAVIVYKLRHYKVPGNEADTAHARKRRQQRHRKVLNMSITIVSVLFLSWGYFIAIILLANEARVQGLITNWDNYWHFSAAFVSNMSYASNFFILLIFNNIYREKFKAIILKRCCTGNH